jgi:hypothetical protein
MKTIKQLILENNVEQMLYGQRPGWNNDRPSMIYHGYEAVVILKTEDPKKSVLIYTNLEPLEFKALDINSTQVTVDTRGLLTI